MVHDERDRAVPPLNSTVIEDPLMAADLPGARLVPSCAEKGGTQIFHKKSMEILWKSFNNILWTTDDSAIGRIEICGDPDSSI